jgi:hypothetical protein
MTNSAQDRIGTIGVELTDAEGQFLASAITAMMIEGRALLTSAQSLLIITLAGKMLAAIENRKAELVREYGPDGARQLGLEAEAERAHIDVIHWREDGCRDHQASEEARADGRCLQCGAARADCEPGGQWTDRCPMSLTLDGHLWADEPGPGAEGLAERYDRALGEGRN